MTDREETFKELTKQYKEKTGVDVRFELYAPTAAYTAKIRAAAQADKLPDVYGVLMQMRDFAAFIKADHIYDLTPYMEADEGAWRDIFFKSALNMNSFANDNQYNVKPGIYGVPIDMNNIQLIYNLDLLEKAGWDTSKLPATWDEFMQLGQMLRNAGIPGLVTGIPGLVSGWGESWLLNCFADNFAWNIMGKDKIIETIKGKIPYTNPQWIEVFDLFKQMRDREMFFPGSVTMVNKEAEQIFANGRAAIAFNGSWCVNVYEGMNPDLRYVVELPPKVNIHAPMRIWGGATSLVVNERSNYKKEAVEFLKWLTAEDQQRYLAIQTNNIPSNKACCDVLKGPISEFADDMDKVVHPRLLPVEEYPLVIEAFNKGIQSIIIKETTPLGVAENVEQTKAREIKKAERFRMIREKYKKK